MPRELFASAVAPPRAVRSRRSSVVLVSGIGHAAAGVVLLVASLTATGSLPVPHQPLTYLGAPRLVRVEVELPPAPRPAPPRQGAPSTGVNVSPDAAPVEAPKHVAPESGLERGTDGHERAGLRLIEAGGGVVPGLGTAEAPLPLPPPVAPAAPVRLHAGIQPPQKLVAEPPVYPPAARLARIEGTVILEAVIDATGRVQSLRVLRSVPLLDGAALDAVGRWQYTPAQLNNKPIPVMMTVTVSFRLQP